jgi:hypothetical protein
VWEWDMAGRRMMLWGGLCAWGFGHHFGHHPMGGTIPVAPPPFGNRR